MKTPNGTVCRRVECRCDCGSIEVFRLPALRSGKTQSCGCLALEMAIERGHKYGGQTKTHGGTGTAEYQIWLGMKARCLNPNSPGYERYGARGIGVCQRWIDSFPAFLADMGPRPSEVHSIDRYPNQSGNYEPGNCRWATAKEQARNTRGNVILEIDGRCLCVSEWAEELAVSASLIFHRLERGWSAEDALKNPSARKHASDPFYRTPLSKRDAAWYAEYERREKEQA